MVELIQERLTLEQPGSLPIAETIFDASDPRMNQLSREERIRMYYARELAAGNLDALAPRYRCSEYGDSQDPYQDILAADPLSDPQIGILASMIRTARSESGEEKQES